VIHMTDDVEFEGLPTVHVSTCDTLDAGWETCVFFGNTGESVVVANYLDVERAVLGHQAFLQRDVLRFITTNRKSFRL
jgi:hypothetical protein